MYSNNRSIAIIREFVTTTMMKRVLLGFSTIMIPSIRSERESDCLGTFTGKIVVFCNLLIMWFTAV